LRTKTIARNTTQLGGANMKKSALTSVFLNSASWIRKLNSVWVSVLLILLLPANGQNSSSQLRSVISNADCGSCMTSGRTCNFEAWQPQFRSRVSVAIVHHPHLERYIVDHACGESLIGEPCSTYQNLALYSFSRIRFIENKSNLASNVLLSAYFDTDARNDSLISGIRLEETSSYLIFSFGGTNGRDDHKTIAIACVLHNTD
jgi:hypothetical protein